MRVARVEYEGQTRTAIVSPSGDSVRLLPPGSTPIEALSTEQPGTDTPLADVRLRAPIDPPTIRDFSVFEQHMEGVRKNLDPNATVPDVFYASPFCYFSNPHAVTAAPGCSPATSWDRVPAGSDVCSSCGAASAATATRP